MPSDLWLRRHPVAGPFALVLKEGNAERLYCLNAEAGEAGLSRGMTLADARALCPDLYTLPADPLRDAEGLKALRRFTRRYSPQVGLDGPDGLVADITGVAHLFGGEGEMHDDLHATFARAGFHLQSAIAPTRGGAWALSRFGGGIIPEGGLEEWLGPLPVAALRLPPGVEEALLRTGLARVADLMALPRAPLSRRFGPVVLQRLDQALGHLPEPVAALADPPHFGVRMSLPEPVGLLADVMAGLERLLVRLCAKLAAAQMGARRLVFDLFRVDHRTIRLDIGLARPMRDPLRIAALFARHVEGVDAGFGIEMLRLEATIVEPMPPERIGQGGTRAEDDLADLLSRLGNRLGFGQILCAHPVESRLPERSFTLLPATHRAPSAMPPLQGPARPVVIFAPEPLSAVSGHPPARFVWRRTAFTTLRAQGPERITPDWWEPAPAWRTGLRDYWRVETREGPRLWLFHTPRHPAWAVQGEFL